MSNANPYSAEANMFVGQPTTGGGEGSAGGAWGTGDVASPLQPPTAVPPPPPATADPFASTQQKQPETDWAGFSVDFTSQQQQQQQNSPEPRQDEEDMMTAFYTGGGPGVTGGSASSPMFTPEPIADEAKPSAGTATTASASPPPPQQQQQPPPCPEEDQRVASHEKSSQCWKIGFYQQFFDVDTEHVLGRLFNAMSVMVRPDYLPDPTPEVVGVPQVAGIETQQPHTPLPKDMYGPLWVSTTVWMALAVFAFMASKLAPWMDGGNETPTPSDQVPVEDHAAHRFAALLDDGSSSGGGALSWMFDFSLILMAMVACYAYVAGTPVLLWLFLKWHDVKLPLTGLWSLFGYGMVPFLWGIPVTVIPFSIVKWGGIILSSMQSLAFIAYQLSAYCTELGTNTRLGVFCLLFIAHAAVTILVYYQILIL